MAKVKLGDVVREYKGKIDQKNNPYEFYVAGDHMDTDDLTIRRRGVFATDDVGPAFIREFKKGQVLYGSRRTYLRKIAVADFDGVTANTTFVLETKNENELRQCLLPFIMYTDSFTEWSIKKSKGSTNPYVLFKDLADYEFDLPDIKKQDELAEILWAMNDVKDAYNRLILSIDEVVQSQFIEMFGEPVSNSRGWDMEILGNTCDIITGNTPPRAHKEYYGHYIEWIKTDNIMPGDNSLSEAVEWLSEEGLKKGRSVDAGAILMTCIAGSLNTIGNAAITDRKVSFNQQINALVPRKYDVDFLFALLRMIRKTIHLATNTNLKCILSKGALSEIRTILPPIELQRSFSEFVKQSDKSKIELHKALDEMTAIYKRLIQEKLV